MGTPAAQKFVAESIQKKNWTGPVIDLGAGIQYPGYKPILGNVTYVTLDLFQDPEFSINIIADILNMPEVQSNTYGVALLLETLEHLVNPFTAFAEISRIIRPGGMFICTTVASWVQHNHPADYWRFLPDGLRVLCQHAGLKIFHEHMTKRTTCIPCQTMVAAIKG